MFRELYIGDSLVGLSGQRGHLHTKTVELEKVERKLPRTLRVGLYLFMRRLSCAINSYESEQEERIIEIVKVHFVTRSTRVEKHTGLSEVRGMFFRNGRHTQVL